MNNLTSHHFNSYCPAVTTNPLYNGWNQQPLLNRKNHGTSMILNFDSYMIPTQELKPGELRLLEVDNRVVLPIEITIRMLISSEDVLHSWAVPSLGLKTDAIPGRLNQTTLIAIRPGLYYGQCSEICGSNHSFIPIVLELVPLSHFEKWSASIL